MMSPLRPGELRDILQRELPSVLAPPYAPARSNGHTSEQQAVQDDAAATMGATDPPPADADAAAATQPAIVRAHEAEAARIQLYDHDAVVLAEHLPDVVRFMRDRLGYELLSHITAVDYIDYELIEVIYHLYHPQGGPGQIVRVRVPRDQPVIPSISPFWPGANLQEREAFDLYGVEFPGHPYHRRIYMWDEFEGHPMRKDFRKIGDAYYHFQWKGEEEEE